MENTRKIQKELLYNDKMHTLIDHTLWSKKLLYKESSFLIVDDASVNRIHLTTILEKLEASTIYEAENGQVAVDIFLKHHVDLVIMDLHMPIMNGFEATYEIKQIAKDTFIPIIVFTAYSTEEVMEKACACGADDILTKPLIIDKFILKLNTLLRLKEFYAREKEFSDKLAKEVEERKLANEKLIAFQVQLKKMVDQKTNELRQRDIELIEMDRITSINTLASGVAHEINNPLGFIKSTADSLKKVIDNLFDTLKNKPEDTQVESFSQRIEGFFTRIDRGIQRITNLIDSLIYLSNINKSQVLPININTSIEETILLIGKESHMYPKYSTDYGELPDMSCVATEIHLCLMNIIRNAWDAVHNDEQGHITIQTRHDQTNNSIAICIEDNGPGISADELRQVFNPFFTTKPVGQGTGIGLTISERVVKRNGGKIILDTTEGEGTIVTIFLPVESIEQCT